MMISSPPFCRGLLGIAVMTVLLGTGSAASADDAVTIQGWNGGAGPELAKGETLVATKSLAQSGMADNPLLNYSAWAHAGGSPWFTFHLTEVADLKIRLDPTNTDVEFNPGLTLWTSGNNQFNGGTSNLDEVASNDWNAPHSFNAFGQVGDPGTFWMSVDPQLGTLGNHLQTLAYAITGESHDATETGWGESIVTGVHDLSIDNLFEAGISGTALAGANWLALDVIQAQPGWYTLFIGGTNHAASSQSYNLSVAAVPLPAPALLMLSALAGLGVATRRRRDAVRSES